MSTFVRWKTAFENPFKYHFQDSQFQNFYGEGWCPQNPPRSPGFLPSQTCLVQGSKPATIQY